MISNSANFGAKYQVLPTFVARIGVSSRTRYQAKYSRCMEGREWVGLGRPGREAYMKVYMYKNKF